MRRGQVWVFQLESTSLVCGRLNPYRRSTHSHKGAPRERAARRVLRLLGCSHNAARFGRQGQAEQPKVVDRNGSELVACNSAEHVGGFVRSVKLTICHGHEAGPGRECRGAGGKLGNQVNDFVSRS